jgi:hypothetical protein
MKHKIHEDRIGYLVERSQIHFRTAKFLIKRGKLDHGYSTLFDSLISGFEFYILKYKENFVNFEKFDITDYIGMYKLINQSNILDFNFSYFDRLLDGALEFNLHHSDPKLLIDEVESILTTLQVFPFDEELLPPIQKEFY